MGRAELLFIALAVIIFGIFSLMALQNNLNARISIINNEIEHSAFSQAEAIINMAWSKHFDEKSTDPSVIISDSSDFTTSDALGVDSGEPSDSLHHFDDLDDFDASDPNSFKVFPEQTVTIEDENGNPETFYSYILKTKVDYVDNNDNLVDTHPTNHKKLTVLIEVTSTDLTPRTTFSEPGRTTDINVDWDIRLSKTFTYYNGYHGLNQ